MNNMRLRGRVELEVYVRRLATPEAADFDAMKQQLNAMQKRIEDMAKKR